MKDKGLHLFLMVVFGTGGTVILILAWALPMALPERIVTTLAGSMGILWMLVQTLSFIPVLRRGHINQR